MHSQVADWLDLGSVLQRSLAKVRSLHGDEAKVQGLIFLCIAAILAAPCWYFDLHPTIEWMANGPAVLVSSLPASLAIVTPTLIVLCYLAPTLLGIGLPRLVASGFKFAELLHLFVALFDASTDFPNVQATMLSLWPRFENMGPLFGGALWYISYGLLWTMATEGFELVFLVCVICGVSCLINGFRGTGTVRP